MSLVKEMHRRNVFRVAALYLVLAWLILKSTHVLIDLKGVAEWVRYACEVGLAIGFPFVLWFAWVFEVTPPRSPGNVTLPKSLGQNWVVKLDNAIACAYRRLGQTDRNVNKNRFPVPSPTM